MMRSNCARLEPLSTGRHYLAFRIEPPGPVLLSPSAALVVALAASMPLDRAHDDFVRRTSGTLTDASGDFRRHLSDCSAVGLLVGEAS